jgi:hypothetical protein
MSHFTMHGFYFAREGVEVIFIQLVKSDNKVSITEKKKKKKCSAELDFCVKMKPLRDYGSLGSGIVKRTCILSVSIMESRVPGGQGLCCRYFYHPR